MSAGIPFAPRDESRGLLAFAFDGLGPRGRQRGFPEVACAACGLFERHALDCVELARLMEGVDSGTISVERAGLSDQRLLDSLAEERVVISLPHQLALYVDALVGAGLFGRDRAEVLERLAARAILDLERDGSIRLVADDPPPS